MSLSSELLEEELLDEFELEFDELLELELDEELLFELLDELEFEFEFEFDELFEFALERDGDSSSSWCFHHERFTLFLRNSTSSTSAPG